jgi:hypothetical protein
MHTFEVSVDTPKFEVSMLCSLLVLLQYEHEFDCLVCSLQFILLHKWIFSVTYDADIPYSVTSLKYVVYCSPIGMREYVLQWVNGLCTRLMHLRNLWMQKKSWKFYRSCKQSCKNVLPHACTPHSVFYLQIIAAKLHNKVTWWLLVWMLRLASVIVVLPIHCFSLSWSMHTRIRWIEDHSNVILTWYIVFSFRDDAFLIRLREVEVSKNRGDLPELPARTLRC